MSQFDLVNAAEVKLVSRPLLCRNKVSFTNSDSKDKRSVLLLGSSPSLGGRSPSCDEVKIQACSPSGLFQRFQSFQKVVQVTEWDTCYTHLFQLNFSEIFFGLNINHSLASKVWENILITCDKKLH